MNARRSRGSIADSEPNALVTEQPFEAVDVSGSDLYRTVDISCVLLTE